MLSSSSGRPGEIPGATGSRRRSPPLPADGLDDTVAGLGFDQQVVAQAFDGLVMDADDLAVAAAG